MSRSIEYILQCPTRLRPEHHVRLRRLLEDAIGKRTLVLEEGLVLRRFPLPPGKRRYQRIVMVG